MICMLDTYIKIKFWKNAGRIVMNMYLKSLAEVYDQFYQNNGVNRQNNSLEFWRSNNTVSS